jgi:hypothetical protein
MESIVREGKKERGPVAGKKKRQKRQKTAISVKKRMTIEHIL